MLEILHFYISSFWVWLGITVGISIFIQGIFLGIKELSNPSIKRRKRKSSEQKLTTRKVI